MQYKHFEYYNPNPKGLETGDCQIRAICKATGLDWYEVYDRICAIGRENCEPFIWYEHFDKFAKEFGFEKRKISVTKRGCKSVTPESFCKAHPTGTYILRLANHVLCAKDGKFWDLYPDFGDSKIYTYWEKVEE